MKRIRVALAAVLATLFVAATAWASSAYVNTYTDKISFTVENTSAYAFVCNGRVFGQTSSGKVYFAWMNQVVVPSGEFRYLYVYTDPRFDPFVKGWSDIACVTPPQ